MKQMNGRKRENRENDDEKKDRELGSKKIYIDIEKFSQWCIQRLNREEKQGEKKKTMAIK